MEQLAHDMSCSPEAFCRPETVSMCLLGSPDPIRLGAAADLQSGALRRNVVCGLEDLVAPVFSWLADTDSFWATFEMSAIL